LVFFNFKKLIKNFFKASLPGMFERTITIGSAGKVFSATGWKTGWLNFLNKNLIFYLKIKVNCSKMAS
jgi:aspartate/methionine/tyrosine aminotransferase